ncbi:YtzH-like protein [Acanthamoeba polyphaga moumouvirus]|uniref:YtzH-like protein n=1 Tax=Acanthamoeba polyphaga moumouvirus TaxID=1269028 RepID=L7RC11_9VIRU|nr:YtzH-like protein [Acanthamoeba polyphaga moumouvirus]AGC01782.1 YtzH-like protein [Acanthamoeba polyphaga moumouvirus]
MKEQIYLDISSYRKKIFGEIIPTNTKISVKFPDDLRSFPFNKKNFDFFDLRTDIAKYTKTPQKYWNKNYDHYDKITRLLQKILNDINIFDIKKIINGTENKNIIKYHQKIYMMIDIFLTINIDQEKK